MANKSKQKPRNAYEVYRAIRKDWDEIKPYTRVIEDKRKKKPKHKGQSYEDWLAGPPNFILLKKFFQNLLTFTIKSYIMKLFQEER